MQIATVTETFDFIIVIDNDSKNNGISFFTAFPVTQQSELKTNQKLSHWVYLLIIEIFIFVHIFFRIKCEFLSQYQIYEFVWTPLTRKYWYAYTLLFFYAEFFLSYFFTVICHFLLCRGYMMIYLLENSLESWNNKPRILGSA